MNKKTIAYVTAALLLLASPAALAGDDLWLHIRVNETGKGGENVSVNIPISMVEAILPMIETEELRGGKLDLGRHSEHLAGLDLREILVALQETPDTNFVTVRSDDENVRVAKENGFLIVNVDEDDERVRVRVPLGVFEALIGEDNELNLIAGLRRLSEFDGGDLVSVQSNDETVRIWIDSDSEGR